MPDPTTTYPETQATGNVALPQNKAMGADFDQIRLEDMPTSIRVCEQNIRLNGWMLGGMLKSAKTRLPHGSFMDWLKAHTDISQTTANELMKLYEGVQQTPFLGELQQSAAVALLALNPAEREHFAALHDVESLTVRQLKAEVEQAREAAHRLEEARLAAEAAHGQNLEQLRMELDTARERAREAQALASQASAATADAQRITGMYEDVSGRYEDALRKIGHLEQTLAEEPIQMQTVEVERVVEVAPPDYEQMKAELDEANRYAEQMERKARDAQAELMRQATREEAADGSLAGFQQATAEYLARAALIGSLGTALHVTDSRERDAYLACLDAVEQATGRLRAVVNAAVGDYRADDAHVV